MLQREGSIFHLGEEGERDPRKASHNNNNIYGVTVRREAQDESLVGLRILIHHHSRESGAVVIKSSVKPGKIPPPPTSAAGDGGFSAAGFLRSCFLCKKELSLQKEVYMYRGDQGFCSVKCRQKQMVADERRENVASKRSQRFPAASRRNGGSQVKESNPRAKISLAA
ncbi:hypothetical protein AXF42_Ash011753 [Apostasia shenzhenica]|uniref:FLZ-type domain-containing protein n=1 Tax=Apostasia shenzhenica TaxID=1088818 RepID=A0A2H9ZUU5_9ASPA|nr:hypothetical protein AXF42_Ash011753 [Apostasia shenzhenica]